MNAGTVIELLSVKHSKDVFIPECKDGPTWHGRHSRLDAWAMRRSWSRPAYFGYEVKVTRSDFLNDKKWHEYLDVCNELYFVCPTNVIQLEECPEQCGLIYVSKTGTRLYTKRRAPRREIEHPTSLLLYALMRAIGFEGYRRRDNEDRDFWRRLAEGKIDDKRIGQEARYRLSERYRRDVDAVQRENERLARQIEKFERLAAFLEETGLSIDGYRIGESVEEILSGAVPREVVMSATRLRGAIDSMLNEWDRQKKKGR